MKNFTQKIIGIFALVFATSFTVNAQCDETLVLTSQGGNGGGSYGNWAWFAGDLRLWLEEGDIVYGSNGSAYTIAGEMAGHYYTNGISQVLFTSNVAGVFTNGNSYNTNIASCTIEGCTEPTAQNYMPNANTDDGSCVVYGCMDESASNFNSIATNEDDSCLYPGCTDPNYLEYDENANTDDGSCSCVSSVEIIVTTTSEEPFEAIASVVGDYSSAANFTGDEIMMMVAAAGPYLWDCLSMGGEICNGAAEEINSELNYNLTGDDIMMMGVAAGPYLYDCMVMGMAVDPQFCYYAAEMINSELVIGDDFIWSYQDEIISTSDEVIISTPGEYTLSLSQNGCETLNQNFVVAGEVISGCTNSSAVNYNEEANSDDGSCIIEGCTDEEAFNYNEQATENDGSCVAVVNGCMDELACNYNSEANTDDSSCYSAEQYYDCNEVCLNDSDQDGVCDEIEVVGCTDSEAFNYDDIATDDDGSCVAVVIGCMDSSMSNYNSEANTEDGSCVSWEELANTLQSELDNVVSEDGVSQEDVDAAYADGIASVTPEDGIGQADVDAAYEAGVQYGQIDGHSMGYASGYDDGAASVTPEDGVSQEDVDAAYAAGVASVDLPECEEVATQNIPLDLPQGWSMFGYTCLESLDVVEAFSDISDNIEIVKDEWGLAYLPAWGFSAFDNLEFGEGYQIKMIEEVTDFQFCTTIAGGASQDELDAAIAEVHAMYEGWCESDLDNDGICDVDEISGCMDASSCNYVSEAEFDDGSCDYESCLDECGVINGDNSSCTDACGVINGDNSSCMDECGVPNGDNSSCTDCAGVLNGASEDLGCGCNNPAAQPGFDCDGNPLEFFDDDALIYEMSNGQFQTCYEFTQFIEFNYGQLVLQSICSVPMEDIFNMPGSGAFGDYCHSTCNDLGY